VDFGTGSRVTVVTAERVGSIVPGGTAPADPSLVGLTTLVTDLNRVADLLTRNGVPFHAAGDRLVVAAADACGCAVLFTQRTTPTSPSGMNRSSTWP